MIGAALVKSFLAEHNTDLQRLFNRSTNPRRVALRAKLIRHLDANGLGTAEIARVLDIMPNTVSYWLNEKYRQKKILARRVNHKRSNIYRWWDQCARALETNA